MSSPPPFSKLIEHVSSASESAFSVDGNLDERKDVAVHGEWKVSRYGASVRPDGKQNHEFRITRPDSTPKYIWIQSPDRPNDSGWVFSVEKVRRALLKGLEKLRGNSNLSFADEKME